MNRRVVITGASSGIGWETALLLSSQGDKLVLAARTLSKLEALAQLCRDKGAAQVEVVECDVTQLDEIQQLGPAADRLGEEELCLVNNAGMGTFRPLVELTPQELETQILVNMLGPAWVTQALLPRMLEAGNGQIVNVLSIAASTAFPGGSAYAGAKAGSHMLARCVALEVRKLGVRVMNIHPGATDTPIWDDKAWKPEKSAMIPVAAIAEAIRDALNSPRDRSQDEMVIMPPGGFA